MVNVKCTSIYVFLQMIPRDYKIHCHCFTGYWSSAKLWLDAFPNLYIGMTPLVTYRSAKSSHGLARNIPIDRLLLETDAPYFVPRCVSINHHHLSLLRHHLGLLRHHLSLLRHHQHPYLVVVNFIFYFIFSN